MKFRSIALATGAGVFSARLFIKKLVTRGGREPKAGRAAAPAAVASGAAASATVPAMAASTEEEWPPQPPQRLDEALRALSIPETGHAPGRNGDADPGDFISRGRLNPAWADLPAQPGIPFDEAVEWLRQARRRQGAEAAAGPGRPDPARAARTSTN